MSESYDKGRSAEMAVAKFTRKKLGVRARRDTMSGAGGTYKSDVAIENWLQDHQLHIEVKHHEKTSPREWYKQASEAASFIQKPVVVFPDDEHQFLAVIAYADILDYMIEIADLRAEVADLRAAKEIIVEKPVPVKTENLGITPPHLREATGSSRTYFCKNDHIADETGRCMQKTCPYSRTYKKKKEKK